MNYASHTFRRRRVQTIDGKTTQLQLVVCIKRPSFEVNVQLEFLATTSDDPARATHADIREATLAYIDTFKNTEEADAVAAALQRFANAFA